MKIKRWLACAAVVLVCASALCEGNVILPSSLAGNLNAYSFENCSDIESVIIPYGVTEIGEGAFKDCASLRSVRISQSVVSIADSAFTGCAPDLVIYGKSGSAAQVYADEHDIQFIEAIEWMETLCAGEKRQLIQGEGYIYASADENIAKVDENGFIYGYHEGQTTVSVKVSESETIVYEVGVVPWSAKHDTICMGHRGAKGYKKDNIIESFLYAAELGADSVELDVQRTKDGKLVIIHNLTIKINGNKENVSDLKYSKMKSAYPTLCTLPEVLEAVKETNLNIMVEIKVSGIEQQVLDCVAAAGMTDRVGYGSFDYNVIHKVKMLDPSTKTYYIFEEAPKLEKFMNSPESYDCDVVSMRYNITSEDMITKLHWAGKGTVVWACNDAELYQKWSALGADEITTDYPDLR